MGTLEVVQANIVGLEVDAVVNAANTSLLGGGGVDGAIHRAAGKDLEFACRMLHGCKPGQAKTTEGFKLPASWIIHTVGPFWRGGDHGETETLRACYVNSFAEARRVGAKSVAFPAISTGIYKFPAELAAEIAVNSCRESEADFDRIILCCFTKESADINRRALEA